MLRRVSSPLLRRLSTAPPSPPAATSTSPARASGGGFLGRLTSLLVGAGLGFGTSFFLVHEELKESNTKLAIAFHRLEERVAKLEGKK